ncbi:heparinase II/III family protein [Actinomyces sp. Z5]|uniref:heparinase II/III domain-containing protein n=1 Tax=Actinomyces sp. Z5 TaxID=2250216 RepID=UPI0011BF5178|nr:heparinase II/III family protein [Actinomyces sp. Z5]
MPRQTAPPSVVGPLRAAWGSRISPEALRTSLLPPSEALNLGLSVGALRTEQQQALSGIATSALAASEQPWPWPRPSDYARYFIDGNRTAYEDAVAARQRRLSRAVLALLALSSAHTGRKHETPGPDTAAKRLTAEVANGVLALCEQSTWCWAAHDDTYTRHGTVLPTVTEPFLDLGAGEVAAQLAWIDALLGEHLEHVYPGLGARVRHEVQVRVMRPFLERRDWHWLGLDGNVHNWSPWIQGNVVVAALRLIEDAYLRAEVISLAIEGLDRYVASLPADGAIDEGSAYWWNGAARLLEVLERLRMATGGVLDPSHVEPLDALIDFPVAMSFSSGWNVSFADARARHAADKSWRTLFHWGHVVGNSRAVALAVAHRDSCALPCPIEAGLGRVLVALADEDWCTLDSEPTASTGTSDGSFLPAQVWLPSIQVSVDRPRAGDLRGLALAAKAGTNGEHHNHNDVGSFLVALDGIPVVIDLGQPTYTALSFSPRRYEIWANRSGWHSVPVIAGREQSEGARFRARDVKRISGTDQIHPGGARGLDMDLAGAYALPADAVWRRSLRLQPDGDGVVTLEDAWALPTTPEFQLRSLERLLVVGDITQRPDALLLTPSGGGRRALLTWSGARTPHIERRDIEDPLLREAWGDHINRISWTLPEATVQGVFCLSIGVAS